MKPRVVLLGASNLARGFAPAVAVARRVDPGKIFIAGGRGRAYARSSVLLVRGLSSIRDCGLWRRLEDGDEDGGELFALITDVGNDLVYGASADETFAAVSSVAERLVEAGARVVISTLPLQSLDRFPTAWLDAVRRSFFPGSATSAGILVDRAHRLDEAIRTYGPSADVTLAEQDGDWYGLDPIHHRFLRQRAAFASMTQSWGGEPGAVTLGLRRRVALAWPERSDLFGRPIERPQPCARLRGGAELHLF